MKNAPAVDAARAGRVSEVETDDANPTTPRIQKPVRLGELVGHIVAKLDKVRKPPKLPRKWSPKVERAAARADPRQMPLPLKPKGSDNESQ